MPSFIWPLLIQCISLKLAACLSKTANNYSRASALLNPLITVRGTLSLHYPTFDGILIRNYLQCCALQHRNWKGFCHQTMQVWFNFNRKRCAVNVIVYKNDLYAVFVWFFHSFLWFSTREDKRKTEKLVSSPFPPYSLHLLILLWRVEAMPIISANTGRLK